MEIAKEKNGSLCKFILTGRLDTVTAPDLAKAVNAVGADIQKLIFDMNGIEYISSAGLRVLITAQRLMDAQGDFVIYRPSPDVRDVLEITGLVDMLHIQHECV